MRPSKLVLSIALSAPALWSQDSVLPEPGVPPALREELRASMASMPRDLFIRDLRQPIPEASVVILENLTPLELKQRTFEEFKVLMLRSLAEFLGRYGDTAPPSAAPASAGTRLYPMGRIDF